MQRLKQIMENRFTLLALGVPLALIAVLLNAFAPKLIVDIYTFALISLMMTLGFQIFMGNSGILNWVYIGFVGIGAFASSIVSVPAAVKEMGTPNMYPFLKAIDFNMSQTVLGLQMGPLVGILAAVLIALAVVAVFAWPLMRLSDAVGAITQFAALIVIYVVMTQWDNVTNGPRTFFGVPLFTTLWVALAGAILTLLIAWFFKESRLGLRLRASRDDKYAAMSTGVNVIASRYVAFILSAVVAAFSGALWAHYVLSFSPKTFYISEMFVIISMLVVGGTGSVTGAVVGTGVVTIVRQFLRQIEASPAVNVTGLTEVCLAIFLILVLIVKPSGITGGRELTWGAMKRFFARFGKKKGEVHES